MYNDVIDWWINFDPLSAQENALCRTWIDHLDGKFDQALNDYFLSHLLGVVPNNFVVRMAKQATLLINDLFEHYVDDDTLVISSDFEHPSVVANLEKCQNVIKLKMHGECDCCSPTLVNSLVERAKAYKRVFIYIIGMTNDASKQSNMEFHRLLKIELVKHNIPHTYVYDDVQGAFYLPRDYSIFDFVIVTGHAPVYHYSLGFLLCREDLQKDYIPGTFAKSALAQYVLPLDIVLKRRHKVLMFDSVIRAYFCGNPAVKFVTPVCTFRSIFEAPTNLTFAQGQTYFKAGDISYCTPDLLAEQGSLRRMAIRAHPYLIYPEMLSEDLARVNRLLKASDC